MINLLAQIPVNGGTVDQVSWITHALDQLVAGAGGIFLGNATRLLNALGLIALVFAGIAFAFGSITGHYHVNIGGIWRAMIVYVVCFNALVYYNQPLPIIGYNVHQIFTEEARWLQSQINIQILDNLLARIQVIFGGMEKPHYWDLPAVVMYVWVVIDMALLEGALFVVTSFSFIAIGIGIIWGPFAICAFMFRATSYLGWAWINYMIKYSLYRVVASMLVFVIATITMAFLDQAFGVNMGAANYSIGQWWALVIPFSLVTMAGLYGCLQIPQLVNDLTTGIAYAGAGFGGTLFGLARGIR